MPPRPERQSGTEQDVVRTGYDATARQYVRTRTVDACQVALLEDLDNRLPRGARVLDVGCAAGVPVTRLLSERFRVTGADSSGEEVYWSHYDAETNLRLLEKSGFTVLHREIVRDGPDPAIAGQHLFLLAQKPPLSQ